MTVLEKQVASLDSYDAIDSILQGRVMHPLQCVDALKLIAGKHALLLNDTGTGKTTLMCAVMMLLWREDPSRKFLVLVMKDQLVQTPAEFQALTGKVVVSSASDAKSVKELLNKPLDYCNVIMLTHECLRSQLVMEEVYKRRESITGVFIDEAHKLNNFTDSGTGEVVRSFCKAFEYCWGLTATPIVTKVEQLARLASIVMPDKFPSAAKLTRALKNGSFDIEDEPCRFVNRLHSDFGCECDYKGGVFYIEPTLEQQTKYNSLECKDVGNENCRQALVSVLEALRGYRGLVYVRRHKVRKWLMEELNKIEGIRFAEANGMTSKKDKELVMRQFNEEKSVDVVVSSLTTSINLDSDFVVFYEYPPDYKQMIGRTHRGFNDKHLEVVFMVVRNSAEEEFFANNVVGRAVVAQSIAHKEYKELDFLTGD